MEQTRNNSLPPYDYFRGIENRNFLSPVGFKFSINRLRGVDFFCQSASIPAIGMGAANQGTRFNKIPHPGDELDYQDLTLRFLVDENLKNWHQVHDWMREITTPYSDREFMFHRGDIESRHKANRKEDLARHQLNNQWRSDASLFILSSNYRPVMELVFRDCFPTSLTTLNFDASVPDINYFTAECVLKYTYYDPYIYDAAKATDDSMDINYRTSERGVNFNTIPSE